MKEEEIEFNARQHNVGHAASIKTKRKKSEKRIQL
jgi:hypothetical protein